MLIDTHCHLDDPPLGESLDAVLDRARRVAVTRVIAPGTKPAQWARLESIARQHSEVGLAVGLHPQCLPDLTGVEIARACGELGERARNLGAVAVGECGFDGGAARRDGAGFEVQTEVVQAHCRAADTQGLPLIVHVLDAMGPALAFFERHGPLRHGAVLHAFSGPKELIPRWVALGFSFGIGPSITWPRARRPKDAARAVPLERLVLETDGPGTYIADAPGRVGEPAQIADVLAALAGLRGVDVPTLAAVTTENARRVFSRLG